MSNSVIYTAPGLTGRPGSGNGGGLHTNSEPDAI